VRYLLSYVPLLCLVLSACGQTESAEPKEAAGRAPRPAGTAAVAPSATDATVDVGELKVGAPLRHGNLTVFPVISRKPQDADRYITLDEGLKAGTVEIRELGATAAELNVPNASPAPASPVQTAQDANVANQSQVDANPFGGDPFGGDAFGGNEVNRLVVVNKSDRPLYLMPGEVIVGGSQDRTIAEELVLAPTGKPVAIDVYCVEHGRWGLRSVEDSAALLYAVTDAPDQAEELAAKTRAGKFAASAGYLNKSSRLAAQGGRGQQAVWDEVEKANAQSKVSTTTMAFTVNYADKQVARKLRPYSDALESTVAEQEQIVGAIVAINGKVESVDVFGSTPLFRKLWPKLLKSHTLDALHAADEEGADQASTVTEAVEFLNEVLQAKVDETERRKDGLVVTKRNSDRVASFAAESAPSADAGGGLGGGFGGAVHTSGFAK